MSFTFAPAHQVAEINKRAIALLDEKRKEAQTKIIQNNEAQKLENDKKRKDALNIEMPNILISAILLLILILIFISRNIIFMALSDPFTGTWQPVSNKHDVFGMDPTKITIAIISIADGYKCDIFSDSTLVKTILLEKEWNGLKSEGELFITYDALTAHLKGTTFPYEPSFFKKV